METTSGVGRDSQELTVGSGEDGVAIERRAGDVWSLSHADCSNPIHEVRDVNIAERPIEAFLDDVAGGGVTPGGGAAAAVTGATGAALVGMVCANTVGREGFEDVAATLAECRDDLAVHRARLLSLADEDAAAVTALMAAYRTEGEGREAAIQAATEEATEVPLAIAEACRDVLELAETATALGNPNAIADGGIGAYLADGVLGAMAYTVRLNLEPIEDEAVADELATRVDAAEREGEAAFAAVRETLAETG